MYIQGHPNLKEIGNSQTKQRINAYLEKSKEKKRAGNNEQKQWTTKWTKQRKQKA